MRHLLALFFLCLCALAPAPALASEMCLTEGQSQQLSRFQDRLRSTGDVAKAKKIARRRLGPAARVLEHAKGLHPGDEGLAEGLLRIEQMQIAVDASATPEQVADAFDTPIGLPADGGCSMSPGEIAATVLGFVLGIIPGIILLILLC